MKQFLWHGASDQVLTAWRSLKLEEGENIQSLLEAAFGKSSSLSSPPISPLAVQTSPPSPKSPIHPQEVQEEEFPSAQQELPSEQPALVLPKLTIIELPTRKEKPKAPTKKETAEVDEQQLENIFSAQPHVPFIIEQLDEPMRSSSSSSSDKSYEVLELEGGNIQVHVLPKSKDDELPASPTHTEVPSEPHIPNEKEIEIIEVAECPPKDTKKGKEIHTKQLPPAAVSTVETTQQALEWTSREELLDQIQSPARAKSNDVFHMLSSEDKLDGDSNYPHWVYMMQHILVSKGVWNIVEGIDVCLHLVDAGPVDDVAGSSTRAGVVYSTTATIGIRIVLPPLNKFVGDSKDKHNITPHIHSARTKKHAWDILAVFTLGAAFTMVDNNTNVFKMFAAEDKLDGDNYTMWAYMMQHVLVSKGVRNIVKGIDVRPGSEDVGKIEDVADMATSNASSSISIEERYPFSLSQLCHLCHPVISLEWDHIEQLAREKNLDELEWLIRLLTTSDPYPVDDMHPIAQIYPLAQVDYTCLVRFLVLLCEEDDEDIEDDWTDMRHGMTDNDFIYLDDEDRGLALGLPPNLYNIFFP
ncbi:hypothetical protein L7F22_053246 [Adiantum nelumboides]|nr:hypothetical protein [Adiantum nelumboides]